jgi:hypothetical protein
MDIIYEKYLDNKRDPSYIQKRKKDTSYKLK